MPDAKEHPLGWTGKTSLKRRKMHLPIGPLWLMTMRPNVIQSLSKNTAAATAKKVLLKARGASCATQDSDQRVATGNRDFPHAAQLVNLHVLGTLAPTPTLTRFTCSTQLQGHPVLLLNGLAKWVLMVAIASQRGVHCVAFRFSHRSTLRAMSPLETNAALMCICIL